MKSDLHIHSCYSDGSDTIAELAENIKAAGIDVFALTDHDTIEGCEEMAALVSPEITFIRGVELTCLAGSIKCHILGYNYDPSEKSLLFLIERGKKLRRLKLETRIKYLKEVWNIELTQDELDWLYSRRSVVKTHLANILVKRGLASDNVSAMKKYLDACKTGNTRFDGIEAIQTIKNSGGIAVWAHPLGGEGEVHLTESEFLPRLNEMIQHGIQGLECYYSRYSQSEIDLLLRCAAQNNLFVSGGSDYHGLNKDIPLGRLNKEDVEVDSAEFKSILGLF